MDNREIFETAVESAPPWLEAEKPFGYEINNGGVWHELEDKNVKRTTTGGTSKNQDKNDSVSAKTESSVGNIDEHTPVGPNSDCTANNSGDGANSKNSNTEHSSSNKARSKRISGVIWVASLIRGADNSSWGRLLKWFDRDNKLHVRAFSEGLFHEDRASLATDLANDGLDIEPGQFKEVIRYLCKFKPTTRQRSVDKLGWFDGADRQLTFIMPAESISSANGEAVVFQPERYCKTVSTMTSKGNLKGWQDNVAVPCSTEPYFVFNLSAGLAGPLLRFAGMETFGFHEYGRTTGGKTTSMQAAASCWGNGADPAVEHDSFIQTWHTTANALEGLAAAHNDSLLTLDELGRCTAKEFNSVIYNLMGGQGKSRMDSSSQLRKSRTWHMVLLSTGEISTKQKIEEENQRHAAKAGGSVRLIDLNVGSEIIRNAVDPKAFADQLKYACSQYYGTAGLAFVRALVEMKDSRALEDLIRDELKKSTRRLVPKDALPEIGRATERFALVEMAGRMAALLGILPFEQNTIIDAVGIVYKEWLREAMTIPDDMRAIESLKDFILRNREGRFRQIPFATDDDKKQYRDLAGYFELDGRLFLFTKEGFKEATKGADSADLKKLLVAKGLMLKNEADRYTTKHSIDSYDKPMPFYAIKEDILSFEVV